MFTIFIFIILQTQTTVWYSGLSLFIVLSIHNFDAHPSYASWAIRAKVWSSCIRMWTNDFLFRGGMSMTGTFLSAPGLLINKNWSVCYLSRNLHCGNRGKPNSLSGCFCSGHGQSHGKRRAFPTRLPTPFTGNPLNSLRFTTVPTTTATTENTTWWMNEE